MNPHKQTDCRTVYKDITLLKRWKEHGDQRFLARLAQLEEIEANDVHEDYTQIQDHLRKINEVNRYLTDIIKGNHYESMSIVDSMIDWIMSDEEKPF